MKLHKYVWFLVIVLSLALIVSACSSGGGGGSTPATSSSDGSGGSTTTTTTTNSSPALSALVVATKVSVVDAQSTTAAKPGFFKSLMGIVSSSPTASSDYNNDKTQVYVEERSMDQFDTINQILCMIGQTKYDAMLNKGNYTALVDQNQCDTSKSNASSAGQQSQNQSSSSTMPSYYNFTVNSSRADNNSPEILKVWIHQPASDHDQPALIYANAVITEGTSSTNPYGIFTMNFAGYGYDQSGALLSSPSFTGTLEAVRSDPTNTASKVLLKFVQSDSHMDSQCGLSKSSSKVVLDRQPDGSAGAGHTKESMQSQCGTMSNELGLAYNSSDFFREDMNSSNTVCLNRTAFDQSAWSYALYDSTGARVQRNSGFPIAGNDSNQYFKSTDNGWVGYWGLWTNGTDTINNGDTVNKVDYNNGSSTSTPYTVFESGGRLHKHTQKLLTLNQIKGIPLNYSVWSGGTSTNYEVVYGDPANSGTVTFYEIATMPQNCGGNCTWSNITPTQIDLAHLQWGTLNFYSQSLNGQAQVTLANCTQPVCDMNGCTTSCQLPSPTAQSVVFYSDDVVSPGDSVPASLACYDQCPTVVNGQATVSMMSGPSSTIATDYTFDTTAMMLKDANNSPVVQTVADPTQPWGVMTGALFDPTAANLALLACPYDPTQTCSWQAQSVLPVYYSWETGPNNWNQLIALKDGNNNFLKFDPPLNVAYVGTGGAYGVVGTTYQLQYSGYGQLNGIPGKCVDMDTGADADCSLSQNSQSIRWVPQFMIPGTQSDGSLTTVLDGSDNTTQYFVKPLQIEQRMTADPASACQTLNIDFTVYTLPDSSLWADPTAADGAEPTVTAAPAVIGGVVQ